MAAASLRETVLGRDICLGDGGATDPCPRTVRTTHSCGLVTRASGLVPVSRGFRIDGVGSKEWQIVWVQSSGDGIPGYCAEEFAAASELVGQEHCN